ncbi:hypothetical protein ACVILI_005990 [Mesorhizobium sp. USDA 4775]
MARRVFFSFHYQRDVWRVNQIRNIGEVVGSAAAGFHDASLWEEAKKKGDAAIQRMIDNALENTSVTVICIGGATAGRKFINYEIRQSLARRNGILGVHIHGLKDRQGLTDVRGTVPPLLASAGALVYDYRDHASLGAWIEQAARAAGR